MLWWMVSYPVCLDIKPHLGPKNNSFTVRQLWVSRCGTPSLTRGQVFHLRLLLALASAHSLVGVPWASWLYLYPPKVEGGPIIPWGTGPFLVISYDLQGYSGGIQTCLHIGWSSYHLSMNLKENTAYLYCCCGQMMVTDHCVATNAHSTAQQTCHNISGCSLSGPW